MDWTRIGAWIAANPITFAGGVVMLFGCIAAVTPTPRDDAVWGRLYRLVDLLALNFGRAKELPPNWKAARPRAGGEDHE